MHTYESTTQKVTRQHISEIARGGLQGFIVKLNKHYPFVSCYYFILYLAFL